MENNAQSTTSAVRWLSRFALMVWAACFIAVLVRILTIHPLNPYATPLIDTFDVIFFVVMLLSFFVAVLHLTIPSLPNEAELKRQIPTSFLDSFLDASRILSLLCVIAGTTASHFLGSVPMMQDSAYFIANGSGAVREISAKWFAVLSYLTSPIVENAYTDSVGRMWAALLFISEFTYKMRRRYRMQKAAAETDVQTDE